MVIQHNLQAMNASRMQGIVNSTLSKSTQKLASGYQINSAADNAAGLSISEKMRQQIRGLDKGANNINEGISYCKIADGALHEIHDMLQRINELAIKAANGTNSDTDRTYINDEIQQLKKEIDRICITTKYNEEYIFKCEDEIYSNYEVFKLSYSGYPDDMFVYNDSYDDATGTVTYGGIAYKGKRYAWSSISPNMYDSATNTFNQGKYTLRADDGTYLTLVCEDGSEPPQVSREFSTSTDREGIYVNGELIPWTLVKDSNGMSLDENDIRNEPYSFNYYGVTVSFTPDAMDTFEDVMAKMSGTIWKSTYKLPTQEDALFADFSDTWVNFKADGEVKNYIDGNPIVNSPYIVKADDTGISVTQGGTVLAGSQKTWADMGITNWGDQSTDIWSDKTYEYSYQIPNLDKGLTFSFSVINEISKDSVIDALDGVELKESRTINRKSHRELDVNTTASNVLGGNIGWDNLSFDVELEYGLGRDYSAASDVYGEKVISYDRQSFSVQYSKTTDGIPYEKTFSNDITDTDKIVADIKKQMLTNKEELLNLIKVRYEAGASNPNQVNLGEIVDDITGDGATTNFADVVTLDFSNPNIISTQTYSGQVELAGASIDFSGLGTSYQLKDLIGTGFNSTCETCDNHYSIQFTTPNVTSTQWKTTTVGSPSYNYSMTQEGHDYTLYIDVESMDGVVANGVDFTNALVNIAEESGFDFHYTQYATDSTGAKLYIYDNRDQYVENSVSVAERATFYPYSYSLNTVADVSIMLFDNDPPNRSVELKYDYDYKDMFSDNNLIYEWEEDDVNGNYVSTSLNVYEKYDPANPTHATLQRYNLKQISIDTQGKTLDEYLDIYTGCNAKRDSNSIYIKACQ